MGKLKELNYKKVLLLILKIIFAGVGIFLAFKLAVFYMPFLIAFIVYKIIKKPVDFLSKKLRFPRALAVLLCILLFLGIIGGIGYLFFSTLIREIISLAHQFNYLLPQTYNNITELAGRFNFFFNGLNLSPEIVAGIQSSAFDIAQKVLTALGNFINSSMNFLINTVVSLPNILIYVIITLLATFFISSDVRFISESMEKHLPEKWLFKVQSIINDLFAALGGYLKAQGILISITFCEIFIFFSFYGIEYALIFAILIAIIDALPILGTGTVLIPWAIVELISSNYRMAIYLIILYLFVLVVRQLIEPKIVGTQIGIYPLLTLFAMYTGVKLIGVLGLIVGPIALIIIKNVLKGIYTKGMIKDFYE